jgi:hypothetical protein
MTQRDQGVTGKSNPGRKQSETQEQIQFIQWCRTDPRFQYIFHIPNESVGGSGWITRNRQIGVKAGVPDLFYPVPCGKYHGMFIEMKAGKGRLSPKQKRWIRVLEQFGYCVEVAYGWEQARDAILKYIEGI